MYAGKGGRGLLALAGAGILPVCASAAVPPPVPPPGASTPGSIGDTLKQPPALQPPTPLPGISAPSSTAPAGSAQGATLVVSHFSFSGNTLFTEEMLAPLVADYLDKPITLAQLYEAADKVADYYARKGYALASVNVPAQKIKDGNVRLEVIEGSIGRIGFEGNHRYHNDILGSFVSRTHAKDIYQSAPLEHDLQTLNALPGLAARAVIQPGADYGTSDVTVKVQEDPIDGYVVVDNYGRKDSGEYRVSASVTLNNPFGVADQLQVLGTHSTNNGLNYGYLDYNVPLNFSGLRFDVNYGHAYFKTAPFDVSGKNNNLQMSLIQPWVRSSTDTFITSLGFLHTDGNADFLGAISVSDTKINLLNLSLNYAHIWANSAVTQYIVDFHTNFSKNSAEQANKFPPNLNHERVRLEINLQHLQPLPARFQLLGLVDAVYSPDPMADTEQFSIGGPTSLRGFPSSEARGDRGYFAQLTLRRPFALGPLSLVPRIYGDTGLVDSRHYPPATNSSNSLTSAGLGADLIYRTIDLKIDWAYPLDSTPVSDGRDDGRVYASLSAGF